MHRNICSRSIAFVIATFLRVSLSTTIAIAVSSLASLGQVNSMERTTLSEEAPDQIVSDQEVNSCLPPWYSWIGSPRKTPTWCLRRHRNRAGNLSFQFVGRIANAPPEAHQPQIPAASSASAVPPPREMANSVLIQADMGPRRWDQESVVAASTLQISFRSMSYA
jgi:hypothetical protein